MSSAVLSESTRDELLALARRVEQKALALGAHEVRVSTSEGTHTTLLKRDGAIEQATQATTRGLSLALLVDGRFSSHSTSDLRPEALDHFLERAVAATRFLEPDPERALPDAELCGRGVSDDVLDQHDPAWDTFGAEDRNGLLEALERGLEARRQDDVISTATYLADGASTTARVLSNGFADVDSGAWFALGGEMTLKEPGGKRPESAAYFSARYLADLPAPAQIAAEIDERARERLGSAPIASGAYPMLLQNRVTGRILGVLGGPLSGMALHQGQSCLADRLGTRIGSTHFTLLDDPAIPRGLGSRPWDGDGLRATPRTIVHQGVLESYYINVYYARKLAMEATTGSRSNWVVPPGPRSVEAIAKDLGTAILVTGFLGGNSNPTTGDFSFGIRGVLLEDGVPTRSLSEMNVSGNITTLFERLVECADDVWEYSSLRTPTLVFDGVQFSGT